MPTARYVMIGGFLGAGKTTAMRRFAEYLAARGLRAGLITNDQSIGLVDTALLTSMGFAVEEITGGCFCCRFNSLVEASERLTASSRPDVFLAEPVGSCTDLVATVSYPLRRMYGDQYSVAPLSVLVDPLRALRIFELEPGRSFSPKVLYVYQKQLEEAEIIVVNKVDLLNQARRRLLIDFLRVRFPKTPIFDVSVNDGTGVSAWFECLLNSDANSTHVPAIDYDLYAEGEALLGWLNATVRVSGQELDGNQLLVSLAERLQRRVTSNGIEIAHLKMTLASEDASSGGIGAISLVRSEGTPNLVHMLDSAIEEGELIINIRAEADPEFLYHELTAVLDEEGQKERSTAFQIEHVERFRPGRPTPTYRFASVSSVSGI
jgi:Ni2+-binding GTPase involved in maturation of urease and hydrogenase